MKSRRASTLFLVVLIQEKVYIELLSGSLPLSRVLLTFDFIVFDLLLSLLLLQQKVEFIVDTKILAKHGTDWNKILTSSRFAFEFLFIANHLKLKRRVPRKALT